MLALDAGPTGRASKHTESVISISSDPLDHVRRAARLRPRLRSSHDTAAISRVVGELPIFRSLGVSRDELQDIARLMEYGQYAPGEVLYEEVRVCMGRSVMCVCTTVDLALHATSVRSIV